MELFDIQNQLQKLNALDLEYLDFYVYNCQSTKKDSSIIQKSIKHAISCNLCSKSIKEYYAWKIVYCLKEDNCDQHIYLDLCQDCANLKMISNFIKVDSSWSSWVSSWIFTPVEPEMIKYRNLFLFRELRTPNIKRD